MICCALIGENDLSTNLVVIQLGTYSFLIYSGVSTANSISIGNALGSGDSDKAKTLANVSFIISLGIGSLLMIFFLCALSAIPRLFTNLPEIVKMVTNLMPVMAVYQLVDAMAVVANGVLRGCGRQKIGAVINLVGYYLLSLPVGISLTFKWGAGLGVTGFWLGQFLAQTILSLLLLSYQFCVIDWVKEVDLASRRLAAQKLDSSSRIGETALDGGGESGSLTRLWASREEGEEEEEEDAEEDTGEEDDVEEDADREMVEILRGDAMELVSTAAANDATEAGDAAAGTASDASAITAGDATAVAANEAADSFDPPHQPLLSSSLGSSRTKSEKRKKVGKRKKGRGRRKERKRNLRREICWRIISIVAFIVFFLGSGLVARLWWKD